MKKHNYLGKENSMKYHCILVDHDFYKLLKITQHHHSISGTYYLDETCIVNKNDLPWFPMDEDASYPIRFKLSKKGNLKIYYDNLFMCKIPDSLFEDSKRNELKDLINKFKDKQYYGIIIDEYKSSTGITKWFNW